MKQKILTYIAVILFPICAFAQVHDSIKITGHLIGNTRFAKVVVQKFGVGTFDIVAVPIKNEKFTVSAPSDLPPGVYRLQYSQSSLNDYVDIIINGKEKEISFSLDIDKEDRMPVFTKSQENQKWYAYQAQSRVQLQKIEVLNQLIAQYPTPQDKIVSQVEEAVEIEKKHYYKSFNKFINENKDTWAGAMIANRPYYFTNPCDLPVLQNFYRRVHFWDGVNTTGPKLINTPLYTGHILNYIQYYMNPDMQFSEEEMEQGFLESVDTIMQKFSGNEETKMFAIKYLTLGFKEIGMEKVLQYIDETYSRAEQCRDDLEQEAFEKRMAGYAAMKPGMPTPEISLMDAKGNLYGLKDISSEFVVIAFWASWCSHCVQVMPELNNWAKEQGDIAVLAVSLDDGTAYLNATSRLTNMLHYCDYQSWESAPVKANYIYGTPTFIFLDKERKIINKYDSYKALINSKIQFQNSKQQLNE